MRTLIIEDLEKVAVTIKSQVLSLFDGSHVDIAKNAGSALQRIRLAPEASYDLILCDYNLGEGTDGQQLLEYLRKEHLIRRRAVFIMITAESSYAGVARAVEHAPDAYLLKPFTFETLSQRISTALERREALQIALAHLDRQPIDYPSAIKACNTLILDANRYALDALKLKAECLITQKQWGEAATVYDKIIAWRPTPWAEVGRARTLRFSGHPDLARSRLENTIANFPQFVAAYDELAELQESAGAHEQAQRTLQCAHNIVPSNGRTRKIGLLALQNGELETAISFLKIVTEKERHGLIRCEDDFFGLAKALRLTGKHNESLNVLALVAEYFPMDDTLTVRKNAAEAIVFTEIEREHEARKRIREACARCGQQFTADIQLELAEACQICGETGLAQQLVVHISENWLGDTHVMAKVDALLQRAGLHEATARELRKSKDKLVELNNEAARLLELGHYDEVVEAMEEVADRLKNNATIQANYVQALLLWVENKAPQNVMQLPPDSKPKKYLLLANDYLLHLAEIAPDHPRLKLLQRMHSKVTHDFACEGLLKHENAPLESSSA